MHSHSPFTPFPSANPRSPRNPRLSLGFWFLLSAFCVLLFPGCAIRPLKGGKAFTVPRPSGGAVQTLLQGENPSQASKQDQETIRVKTYTLPPGSRIEQSASPTPSHSAPKTPTLHYSDTPSAFVLAAPMPVTEREETRARTELGSAQKDTAREIGAKLASLKGIVWVGVAMFLFGLASIFYPPLRVIVGSITTSAAILAGGLALMVLPTLIVGNELLIMGGVGLGVGAWFLAHRHGQLLGQLTAATSFAPSKSADLTAAASPLSPNPNPASSIK